ncbi:hypothetical protein EJ110_NYTH08462 [Nymphaea thermarum]|nr:hypothetical protein EJ110_NYTH08462 [Nymphaea thermarum]
MSDYHPFKVRQQPVVIVKWCRHYYVLLALHHFRAECRDNRPRKHVVCLQCLYLLCDGLYRLRLLLLLSIQDKAKRPIPACRGTYRRLPPSLLLHQLRAVPRTPRAEESWL